MSEHVPLQRSVLIANKRGLHARASDRLLAFAGAVVATAITVAAAYLGYSYMSPSYGAIAGGFLIGFAETLAVFDWSVLLKPLQGVIPFQINTGLSLVPTEYKLSVSFVILVIVLLARPTGIFKGASS